MHEQDTEMIETEAHPPFIAASSYLNSVPLIWSFMRGTKRHDARLLTDAAPAVCAEMLGGGLVKAALVPVIEYHRIPGLVLVPEVCIGSRSAVRSVVLVMRENLSGLREVRSVALDVSSRTSAALVQIIFREFLGIEPIWKTCEPDLTAMLKDSDAALIIGDPGITFARENVVVYDLATLWREHTGLGFVFAMWMGREPDRETVRRIDFAAARDEGTAHFAEIAYLYEQSIGLRRAEIISYLQDNIAYALDEELRAGLDLFYKLARKHGIISVIQPLRFIDD